MKWILGAALSMACVSGAHAQIVVRGAVSDGDTGATLPAATVQVQGTYRGTITNSDGAYQLKLDRLPATIVVRYIGYATQSRVISPTDPLVQDFRLKPIVYRAQEIVVTGENPAARIMREVIKRKKVWRSTLESYEATAYNRFAVSNDTGIVSIMETATEAFWDRDHGTREVVKARRETSNMTLEEDLPAALFVTNLYDDDIEIGGHNLMGVTHPDALSNYRFELDGTRRINDRKVYDISVRPRSKTKSAFVGRVSVLDSAYALIDVELAPGESFIFPPPLDRFDVTYRQQFSNFGGNYWLPVDFRATLRLKISFGLLLSFPTISIEQVSRLTDYQVNGAVPDSLFAEGESLTVDSSSVAADTLLSAEGIAVPLSQTEQRAYVEIDSSLSMVKAFAPSGILARFVKVDDDENDRDSQNRRRQNGRADGGTEHRKPLLTDRTIRPQVWYDRVNQFHLGADLRLEILRRLKLTLGGGYNVAPDSVDRWSYTVRGRIMLGPRRRAFLEAGYESGSVTRYGSELYGRGLNGAVVALGGADYFDYYWRKGYEAAAGYGFDWNQATLRVGYRSEDHTSQDRTLSQAPIGARDFRSNPSIEEGQLRALTLTVTIGDRQVTYGLTGTNRLLAEIERGGGDFDYTRYSAAADISIPTFFRRRLIPNTLDMHVAGGTYSGTLPPQRAGIIEGSLGPYRPFGGLRTLSDYPYEGDQWFVAVAEHSFRTIPFELLGLRWFVRKSYNLIVFGGLGRTWLSSDSLNENGSRRTSDGWHSEVGISLSGLFGIARIDLAKRLDATGFTVGLAVARIF